MMPTDNQSQPAKQESVAHTILRFWPIILALTLAVLSLGGIYTKLDYISKAIDRSEQNFTMLNERQNLMSTSIMELRGRIDRTTDETARHGADIASLRGKLDLVQDRNRWTPK